MAQAHARLDTLHLARPHQPLYLRHNSAIVWVQPPACKGFGGLSLSTGHASCTYKQRMHAVTWQSRASHTLTRKACNGCTGMQVLRETKGHLHTWRTKKPGSTQAKGVTSRMSQKAGAGARTSMNRW